MAKKKKTKPPSYIRKKSKYAGDAVVVLYAEKTKKGKKRYIVQRGKRWDLKHKWSKFVKKSFVNHDKAYTYYKRLK